MIYYATDTSTRRSVYASLMIAAITVQYTITPYITKLSAMAGIPLASPTAFFIFWLFYIMYDNFFWRLHIAKFHFSRIPDFSGDWVGYIERRKEYVQTGDVYIERIQELIAVQLYIAQSFQKISIRLRSMATDHSIRGQESEATSAGIFAQDFAHPKLKYTWSRLDLSGEGELLLKADGRRIMMEGNYSSNHPRLGVIRLVRKSKSDNWYCGQLTTIRDSENQIYVGIHIPEAKLISYLQAMRTNLSDEQYAAYTANQSLRDDGGFHLTVLEPREYTTANKEKLGEFVENAWLWVQFIGLGRQTRGDDEVYYCVAHCDAAQQIRNKLGFGNKDLHATLGFRLQDIHGVPKGVDTLVKDNGGRSGFFSKIVRYFRLWNSYRSSTSTRTG